jgi:hypothetical protein
MPKKGVVPPQFKKHHPPSWKKKGKSGKRKGTKSISRSKTSNSMAKKSRSVRRAPAKLLNIKKKHIVEVGLLAIGTVLGYEISKVM